MTAFSSPRSSTLPPQQKERRDEEDVADEDEDGPEGDALSEAPTGDKDVSGFENFDPKKFLGGEVVAIQAYGAFVRLDDAEVDGYVRVWGFGAEG